jgi:hypothetical protein
LDFDSTWDAAGAEMEAIEVVKRIFTEHAENYEKPFNREAPVRRH